MKTNKRLHNAAFYFNHHNLDAYAAKFIIIA